MGNKKNKKPNVTPLPNKKGSIQSNKEKKQIKDNFVGNPLDKKELIRVLIFAFVIVAAAIALYYPTLGFKLVFCDDNIFVLDNQAYNQDLSNIMNSFKSSIGTSYYRPILNMSFIMDAQFTGIDPYSFHATNFVLHVLGSLLVFITLIRLGYPSIPSFLMGMFFTIHPLLTPAASWISGRNDSLITVFILLSFISVINFLNSRGVIRQTIHFLLNIIFFTIAMFTKEIAGVYPLLIMFYIILFRKQSILNFKVIILGLGYSVVELIWFILRKASMEGINNPDSIGLDALFKSLPTPFAMLGKVILPWRMNALSTFEDLSIISGIVFIIGLVLLVIFLKNIDRKKILFGCLWFVILVFPTLLVRIAFVDDFFDYAEHRMYLLFFGIIIILMEILIKKVDFKKPLPIAIFSLVIIAFGLRAYIYVPKFYDRMTFWSNFVDVYPYKSRGYLDLGKAYFVINDMKTAEKLYYMGVQRNPNNKNLFIDLCAVYLNREDYKKAIEVGVKAYQIDPSDPLSNFNLGRAYFGVSNFKLAAQHMEMAVSRRNNISQWWIRLGICYHNLGQYDKAVQTYISALQIDPNDPLAYTNLGAAYGNQGKFNEAIDSWNKAITLSPQLWDAYNNLINFYIIGKNPAKAVEIYNKIKKLGGPVNQEVLGRLRQAGYVK